MEKVDDLNCIMAPDMRKQMEAPNFSSTSDENEASGHELSAEALTKRIELSRIREKDISFQPVFVDQNPAFLLTLKLAGRPKFTATLTEANFTSNFIDVSQVRDVMVCCLGKLVLPESNCISVSMTVELIQRQIPNSLPVEGVVITVLVSFNSTFKRKQEEIVITLQPEQTSELTIEISQLREELEDGFEERDNEIAELKEQLQQMANRVQGCAKKVIWNDDYELLTLTLSNGNCVFNGVQLFNANEAKNIKYPDQREQRLAREFLMDAKEDYRTLANKQYVNAEELQTLEYALMNNMFRASPQGIMMTNLLNFVQCRCSIETVLQAQYLNSSSEYQILFYGRMKPDHQIVAVKDACQVFVSVENRLSPEWLLATKKAYPGKALKTHIIAEGEEFVTNNSNNSYRLKPFSVFEVIDTK